MLQIYPTISLVRHYRKLVDQGPEDLQIGIGEIAANRLSGRHQAQSRTTRTVHEAELWRSADVPFGLARWQVKITRYKKQANDPRDRFQLKTETLVVMEAKERGADADSDLAVQ